MQTKNCKPIGVIGYILWPIVFSIPIIGQLILLIKAIGGRNYNVRHYARGILLSILIPALLSVGIGYLVTNSLNLL